jgi:hypothetical protein
MEGPGMDSTEFKKQMRYRDLLLGLILGLSIFNTWSSDHKIQKLIEIDQQSTKSMTQLTQISENTTKILQMYAERIDNKANKLMDKNVEQK